MQTGLILEISKTLLLARFKQTLVATIGVAFGICTFITLVSFMTGLNHLLDSLILNRTPHILLYNETKAINHQPITLTNEFSSSTNFISSIKPKDSDKEIRNSLAIIDALKKDENVFGIAPRVTAQVFYKAGKVDINGIVFGIIPEDEERLFAFKAYMVDGDPKDLDRIANSIILGQGIAKKMLLSVGDYVEVSTVEGNRLSLKVVGIFQQGIAEIDDVQSYVSLETAQQLEGKTKSYITDIQINLKDINKSPDLAEKYQNVFDTDTKDIIQANAQFETGSSIRNIITYSVSITLLIVAGFGIYNILNMMIYEKMDSIAIMKATGFSGKDVKRIFLSLSMIIGTIGGIAGLFLGFVISLIIDQVPFETTSMPTVKTFPINYNLAFYLIGVCFAMATTYLSGYFPAKRASEVDPVDIIRGK